MILCDFLPVWTVEQVRTGCCCLKVAGMKEQLMSSEDGASVLDSTWSRNNLVGAFTFSPSEVKTSLLLLVLSWPSKTVLQCWYFIISVCVLSSSVSVVLRIWSCSGRLSPPPPCVPSNTPPTPTRTTAVCTAATHTAHSASRRGQRSHKQTSSKQQEQHFFKLILHCFCNWLTSVLFTKLIYFIIYFIYLFTYFHIWG